MPRFVAVRRRRVTTGTAPAAVAADGTAAAAADAGGLCVVDAGGAAGGPQLGQVTLLGEGAVFPAGAATVGAAAITVDATGYIAASADLGFPYMFAFTFGGPVPIRGDAAAAATVTVGGVSDAAAEGRASADIAVTAFGDTTTAGFPFNFPAILN